MSGAKRLSDGAVSRLRVAVEAPDLTGTRYRIVRRVGRGGMGSVYLAHDDVLDRPVAIKVLDLDDALGRLTERLAAEARVLARLEHPGIVPVHDVGRLPDGRVFYAMRYVEGRPLHREVERVTELPARLRLFLRVCEAAAFAHDRGVLHRDLKPENVMVGPFGEVLVMDWGVAHLLGRPDDERVVVGTPGYMSPEQAKGGTEGLDPRSDVYSLGAMLRFLLPERPPRPLLSICGKAMDPDPRRRYPGALDLAADVTRFLDGQRVEAHPEGVRDRLLRIYGRHKVAFWLVTAYVVVRGMMLAMQGLSPFSFRT